MHAEKKHEIVFSEGVIDTNQSEAIAFGLFNELDFLFKFYMQESHFIYGDKELNFNVSFKTAYADINFDGKDELFVEMVHPLCGNSGCEVFLLENRSKIDLENKDPSRGWVNLGKFKFFIESFSSRENKGYAKIHGSSRWYKHKCLFIKEYDTYECLTEEKKP